MPLSIRVLILEDYEDDCLLLLRELRKGEFDPVHLRVETKVDMEQALENESWDIILSDYSMPSFDAPEALKVLKNAKKDIPFIVVSGNVGEVIAVQLMKFGAADFISKNKLSRLCPAIRREITESKLRQEQLESKTITNRLWDIFNHSLNEIYVFDATTYQFMTVNESALQNLGYSQEEINKKYPWDINADLDETSLKQRINSFKSGDFESTYYETTQKRKDGTTYPAEVRLQLSIEEKPIFYAVVLDITERKKSTEKIESLARFPEENPQPVLRINFNNEIIYNNPSSLDMVKTWYKTSLNKIPESWRQIAELCENTNNYQYFEDKAGDRIYSWLLFPSLKGKYISCYGRDVTEQKQNEQTLKQAYQVFENVSEGIMICNKSDIITATNPAFTHIMGHKESDIIGKNACLLDSGSSEEGFCSIGKSVVSLKGKWQGEHILKKSNGEKTPVSLSISTIKSQGKIHSYIYVFTDISERNQALAHIHNLSYFDPITNLPNRLHIKEKLADIINIASDYKQNTAIIYLDLTRFKKINESLGHQTADKALALVSHRLSAAIPEDAALGRMGADEFVIIINNQQIESEENEVIQSITSIFEKSFELQGQETYLNATLGVSHFPKNGSSADELIKHAEFAVAQAKRKEKSIEIYSNDLHIRSKEHIKRETNLRKALEKNEYVLFYQPQIDLKTKEIVAVEALIRWNQPGFGLVQPSEVIPVLEETGLIIPVGNWVIEEACRQLKKWKEEGITGISIAVNLSGKQFNQKNLAKKIMQILSNANIKPEMIELEVTESTIMQQYEEVIATLNELHNQGFKISIDDFGTGYSSLAYLKHFPIDVLKVDRSFVMEIPDDKSDTAIVNTIISMGHNLNLKVIAEGVEKVEQMNILTEMGCELAQGFYFSKPLPADEITIFINKKINK